MKSYTETLDLLKNSKSVSERKDCVDSLFQMKCANKEIFFATLSNTEVEHLDVLKHFLDRLKPNGKKLHSSITESDFNVSQRVASLIITHLHPSKKFRLPSSKDLYNSDSRYKFCTWILNSNAMTDEEKLALLQDMDRMLTYHEVSGSVLVRSLQSKNKHITQLFISTSRSPAISFQDALKIIPSIDSIEDTTLLHNFTMHLLSSSAMNDAQKNLIFKECLVRIANKTLSQICLNNIYNASLAGPFERNVHSLKWSAYLGANTKDRFCHWYLDLDTAAGVPVMVQSHLHKAETKEFITALLSCGYVISDEDKQEFEREHKLKQTVIECLRNVRPIIHCRTRNLITYLGTALGCDTPVLEAVHCSINGIYNKGISEAIEQNKKTMGGEMLFYGLDADKIWTLE